MSLVSNTDLEWINAAMRAGLQSSHPYFLFGAIVTKGGRVLGHATNAPGTGRHAELRLLSQDIDFTGCTLIVVRVNRRTPGVLRCSRPCEACFLVAKSVGIRRIVYLNRLNQPEARMLVGELRGTYQKRPDMISLITDYRMIKHS